MRCTICSERFYHGGKSGKGLEDAEPLLPDTAERIVVEGGNHAYFGNYGEQEGDGTATISREQQQEEAVNAIEALAKAA